MKKAIILVALLLVIAMAAGPAYALTCRPGGPSYGDECWLRAKIGDGYTTLVSRGHVLVVSEENTTVPDGKLTRLSGASNDEILVGVAQDSMATGDNTLVLARGKGAIQLVNAAADNVTSGDELAITEGTTLTSRAGTVLWFDPTIHDGSAVVGHSLETQVADDATNWAYITII